MIALILLARYRPVRDEGRVAGALGAAPPRPARSAGGLGFMLTSGNRFCVADPVPLGRAVQLIGIGPARTGTSSFTGRLRVSKAAIVGSGRRGGYNKTCCGSELAFQFSTDKYCRARRVVLRPCVRRHGRNHTTRRRRHGRHHTRALPAAPPPPLREDARIHGRAAHALPHLPLLWAAAE